VAAALRVLGYAKALDQPDLFLRMGEENIRQFFLWSMQHITEVYARTVKLPTNEDAKVISQRFA
jgi:undecaprenyl pyrophosphate synthase